jgi:ubiquinone biosynthesis protein UbiJ
MADYKGQLEKIAESVQNKKIEKVKLEERLKRLESDRADILKQLEDEFGLQAKELDSFLEKEARELEEGIKQCQSILAGA